MTKYTVLVYFLTDCMCATAVRCVWSIILLIKHFFMQTFLYFVTRFRFCKKVRAATPIKKQFLKMHKRVTWQRVQSKYVRVHCFYVNKDARDSSVARVFVGQIGIKYGARGAAETIDRWCDGSNWSGMELFPLWVHTFVGETVRALLVSLECLDGRRHQQEKSGEPLGF